MDYFEKEKRERNLYHDACNDPIYPDNSREAYLQRKLGDDYVPNRDVIEENHIWWEL